MKTCMRKNAVEGHLLFRFWGYHLVVTRVEDMDARMRMDSSL